ncbi:MAG: tyrosine-protein phosphatase [Propionibacteriaceae bacterium]
MNRKLKWTGYVNARTLTGISAESGVIADGKLYRAERPYLYKAYNDDPLDVVDKDAVWEIISEANISRIVDLRRTITGDNFPILVNHPAWFNEPIVNSDGIDIDSDKDTLAGIYVDMLEQGSASFVRVISAIAEAPDGAVLVHCTAGKDRTGLVMALLLGLLGVSDEDIVDDYAMTRENLAPFQEEWLATISDTDEREKVRLIDTNAPKTAMIETLRWLYSKGGILRWLKDFGLSCDIEKKLVNRLIL